MTDVVIAAARRTPVGSFLGSFATTPAHELGRVAIEAALADAEQRRQVALLLAESLQLPVGNAVDFWTEAALFSQAGLTALVYGPGDIAQAHAADEFVLHDQLVHYTASIVRILGN